MVNLNGVMARAGLFAIRQPEKPIPMQTPIAKAIDPHPRHSNAERVLDAIYSVPETDTEFENFLAKLIREGKSSLAFSILVTKRLEAISDTLSSILNELKTLKNKE